jgi:hypothetical protein
MQDADYSGGGGGEHKSVESIHQTAVARDDAAAVLRAKATFDRRFEKIARL